MIRDIDEIPDDEFHDMVRDLCDVESGLSHWEVEFVDDVADWTGNFSDKQKQKIKDLWEKHV